VIQPSDGIEIGAGEHVSNLRLVTTHGTLSLQGEIRIVGGALPKDIFLYISASKVGAASGNPRGFLVDARKIFVIDHLSPGEYELQLRIGNVSPGSQNVDPLFRQRISQARQKVVVSSNNQLPVILTVELSQEGSNQ
jgi:hypothetical protein